MTNEGFRLFPPTPFLSCLAKIKAVAQSKAADGISFLLFYFTLISGVAGVQCFHKRQLITPFPPVKLNSGWYFVYSFLLRSRCTPKAIFHFIYWSLLLILEPVSRPQCRKIKHCLNFDWNLWQRTFSPVLCSDAHSCPCKGSFHFSFGTWQQTASSLQVRKLVDFLKALGESLLFSCRGGPCRYTLYA